jgi:hypothetical protein
MAEIKLWDSNIKLNLPVQVPDFTLSVKDASVREVSVNGEPITQVFNRSAFKSGTFYTEGDNTLIAFDPEERNVSIEIQN